MADRTRSKDPSPWGSALGVGLGEVDREVLRLRAPPGDVEQGGHVVDAGGGRPPAGRREGDVPGAGRDVEDAGAGCDADVLDEVLGHRHREGGDAVVVTAAPHLLLLVAQLGHLWGRGHAGSLSWGRRRRRPRSRPRPSWSRTAVGRRGLPVPGPPGARPLRPPRARPADPARAAGRGAGTDEPILCMVAASEIGDHAPCRGSSRRVRALDGSDVQRLDDRLPARELAGGAGSSARAMRWWARASSSVVRPTTSPPTRAGRAAAGRRRRRRGGPDADHLGPRDPEASRRRRAYLRPPIEILSVAAWRPAPSRRRRPPGRRACRRSRRSGGPMPVTSCVPTP